ncbi:MAG TPA: peptidoglycan DD-metalloendopeptidase family protein [Stellaceae bacterium]|jgi:murein DD-endopeptidase MepM/ murein hydrolase activator NlpD
MENGGVARRGAGLARTLLLSMLPPAGLLLAGLLLTGCGTRFGGPAPVVNGGEAAPAPAPAEIVVQRGQTLSGIAHHYHVPMQVVAEANHLSPPYRILAGAALVIPGGMTPTGAAGPSVAMATAPPAPPFPETPVATATLPPPTPEGAARGASSEPDRGQPVPLGPPAFSPPEPAAPRAPPQIAGGAAPAQPTSRATAQGRPPASAVASLTPPGGLAAPAHTEAPGAPRAVATAEPPPAPPSAAHRGGSFLWPVRGHVLENYGTGPDGTHNDGINIAAPRGAPVQATDAGVVAYAGNELRGYGNLVLIKHPNGWISAYAHCDLILVRTGQKVARGQVIARVGSTGNVSEPQLHFELRRGKQPVNPRDYLAPLSSAATTAPRSG